MLRYEQAKAVEGQAFQVVAPGGMLDITLVAVDAIDVRGRPRPNLPIPFVMHFQGTPGLRCPQMVHRLVHPQVGELDIFLVATGHNAATGEYRYQANFN